MAVWEKIRNILCKWVLKVDVIKKWHFYKALANSERGEFGMSSIIGIAIGLIIAAFILIPGIQTFANKIMSDMQLWWTNSISTQIFPK